MEVLEIMANKFTKSVLERQAKEMKARSSKPAEDGIRPAIPAAPAETAPAIPPEPTPADTQTISPPELPEPTPTESRTSSPQNPPNPEIIQEPIPETVPAPPAGEGNIKPRPARKTAAPLPDLTAFIVRDEGRNAKNKTFYLDEAVIDALHRAAVAQKITDSKLVNDILKKILGV